VIVEGIVVGKPDAHDTLARTNLRVKADHLLMSNLSGNATRTVRGIALVHSILHPLASN